MTPGELIGYIATVAIALIGSFGGSAWLLRRQNKKLIESQASKEDAEADKIRDDIARAWLKDLQAEVGSLRDRLAAVDQERTKEQQLRRMAIAWALALMTWIEHNLKDDTNKESIPGAPHDLRDFI